MILEKQVLMACERAKRHQKQPLCPSLVVMQFGADMKKSSKPIWLEVVVPKWSSEMIGDASIMQLSRS